jgi:hypothetical protein
MIALNAMLRLECLAVKVLDAVSSEEVAERERGYADDLASPQMLFSVRVASSGFRGNNDGYNPHAATVGPRSPWSLQSVFAMGWFGATSLAVSGFGRGPMSRKAAAIAWETAR